MPAASLTRAPKPVRLPLISNRLTAAPSSVRVLVVLIESVPPLRVVTAPAAASFFKVNDSPSVVAAEVDTVCPSNALTKCRMLAFDESAAAMAMASLKLVPPTLLMVAVSVMVSMSMLGLLLAVRL